MLKERRIAVLAGDGFEKVELTVPVKALRLAGGRPDLVINAMKWLPRPSVRIACAAGLLTVGVMTANRLRQSA